MGRRRPEPHRGIALPVPRHDVQPVPGLTPGVTPVRWGTRPIPWWHRGRARPRQVISARGSVHYLTRVTRERLGSVTHDAERSRGLCGWRQLRLFEEVTDGSPRGSEAAHRRTHRLSV